MIWTVDTWLLARANADENTEPLVHACQEFLYLVLGEHEAAISEEAYIEYEKRALRNKQGFAAKWYSKMMVASKLKFVFEPEKEDAARLRARLAGDLPAEVARFDSDDVPFVVLCYRTEDRHLISGDVGEGDYCKAFTGWIRDEYGICFHDVKEQMPYHEARHECTRPEPETEAMT